VPDAEERKARATQNMVAEFDLQTDAVTVIDRRDSLVVVGWDANDNTIALKPGTNPSKPDDTLPGVWYRKTAAGWVVVPPAERRAAASGPDLLIDEGMNTPWRLAALDPESQKKRVVYEPNPSLLTSRRLAQETVFCWRLRSGATAYGGLYWPPDYVPGRRYPLVIQTHGFNATSFAPDGYSSTGYAAQPLANAGIFVLQIGESNQHPKDTRKTTFDAGPSLQRYLEDAIAALDAKGLIDRTKVGLQGFSATTWVNLYFLTHSQVPIAAVSNHDGWADRYLDPGYRTALAATKNSTDNPSDYWDSPPWHESTTGVIPRAMLERAPDFRLDRVRAPLQMAFMGAPPLLDPYWAIVSGLRQQGTPAELIYFPDGSHILVRPLERLTSQQGALDWFRFWLQNYEDPDPTKRERYAGWRIMREQANQRAERLSR
jgi:dipeptidyl aminopeptidase/acylaminoacyl peptidase